MTKRPEKKLQLKINKNSSEQYIPNKQHFINIKTNRYILTYLNSTDYIQ